MQMNALWLCPSVSHPGGIRERENYFAGVFIWVRIRTASEIERTRLKNFNLNARA